MRYCSCLHRLEKAAWTGFLKGRIPLRGPSVGGRWGFTVGRYFFVAETRSFKPMRGIFLPCAEFGRIHLTISPTRSRRLHERRNSTLLPKTQHIYLQDNISQQAVSAEHTTNAHISAIAADPAMVSRTAHRDPGRTTLGHANQKTNDCLTHRSRWQGGPAASSVPEASTLPRTPEHELVEIINGRLEAGFLVRKQTAGRQLMNRNRSGTGCSADCWVR